MEFRPDLILRPVLNELNFEDSYSEDTNKLLEKTKSLAKRLLETEENLIQLHKIIPELPNISKEFQKIKKAIENDQARLTKECSFDEIKDCANDLKRCKQELKEIVFKIEESLLNWEQELTQKIAFDVDHSALSEEYGFKHARLVEQAELFSKISLPHVVVPLPHGLSNTEIQNFLRLNAKELESRWNELAKIYDEKKSLQDVLPKLKEIQAMIIEAFEQNQIELSPEFLSWLEGLQENESYLMVRSSGSEDSRKTANAGGNISIPYVSPNPKDLSAAVGKVVASYFSESSLQNRINADENPFVSPLKLGVTTQELIGEPIGGAKNPKDIPVSLVLFSNEPTYVGDEPFRLMRISATWGHGEGVVGEQGVKSDTILILKSVKHPDRLYILENNQVKPRRLAPVRNEEGAISLGKLDNPKESQERGALDHEMLTRLYYLGVAVEKAYGGHPMDMEVVVKNGIIHPVQARPIHRPAANPTYFDFKKADAVGCIRDQFKAEAFLPGLASAEIIKSQDEIVLTADLDKAERVFKKETHKLVITSHEEGANTHPVVNFSSMGVPAMYHEKTEEIQKLIDQINNDQLLIACTQSGNLVLCDKSQNPETYISPGYTVHPAKVTISSSNTRLPSATQTQTIVPQELKDLIMKLRAIDTRDAALEAIRALKALPNLAEHKKILAERVTSSDRVRETLTAVESLEKTMARSLSELKATLKRGGEGRLHPLFHEKAVERLLVQPEAPRGLGIFSVVSLESQMRDMQEIFRYQDQFDFPTVLHDEILDAASCMTPEHESVWRDFIIAGEMAHHSGAISKGEIDQFKTMLTSLRDLKLLTTWMTCFFLPEPEKSLQNFLRQMSPETVKLLALTQELDQEIQGSSDLLSLFSDTGTFEKGFEHLLGLKEKLSVLQNKDLLNKASPIGRMAAYKVMEEFVTLYDSAIKSMKASRAFEKETQVEVFDRMLHPYFDMLRDLTENLSGNLIQYHQEWPLWKYLDKLKALLEGSGKGVEQLNPSGGFSVAAGVLGNVTAFERSYPKTKEDVFTLIHQNLLHSLGVLLTKETKQMVLPPLLEEARKSLEKIAYAPLNQHFNENLIIYWPGRDLRPQLTGFSGDSDQITLHYNCPLRFHSATFSIRFDKKTQTCALDANFIGESRGRYFIIHRIMNILDSAGIVECDTSSEVKEMELTLKMNLNSPEKITHAMIELKQMIALTFTFENDHPYNIIQRLTEELGDDKTFDVIVNSRVFDDFLTSAFLKDYLNQLSLSAKSHEEIIDILNLFIKSGRCVSSRSLPETMNIFLEKLFELLEQDPVLTDKIKNSLQKALSSPEANRNGLLALLEYTVDKEQSVFSREEIRALISNPHMKPTEIDQRDDSSLYSAFRNLQDELEEFS